MITARIKDIDLKFETDHMLFSPSAIDEGTLAMLSVVDFKPGDRVLDLGCGYGAVGILAAKLVGEENVVMCDVSRRAVEYARKNALLNGVPHIGIQCSDGYAQVEERDFSIILSNPPYHADFSVPKRFIEGGFKRLALGGRFVMVTKRLLWYKNKLTTVFGGVRVYEINDYYVFVAEKRTSSVKKK